MSERKSIYFHIDVNSAFLSWEATYRLVKGDKVDIRKIPSAIGGSVEHRHGIILAKSELAKRAGVKTGETIAEARAKCPDILFCPPNYTLYNRCSAAFMEILRRYSPIVEQYSIDEAFIDMTGTERLWGEPEEAGDKIRKSIREELGFTVNVGISENRLLAKMAGELKKPDKTLTLYPNEIQSKLWPMPVRELFFIGHATERKLNNLGIRTIGEIAKADPAMLRSHMKSHGDVIYAYANGLEGAPIVGIEDVSAKGYGNSTTMPFDVVRIDDALKVLLSLSESVSARIRADEKRIKVVAVSFRDRDLVGYSAQKTLPESTCTTGVIWQAACEVFLKNWRGTPLRQLGVHTSKVGDEDGFWQSNFLDSVGEEKWYQAENAVDRIRGRYGKDSVIRATFLDGRIDSMAGGITKDRLGGV